MTRLAGAGFLLAVAAGGVGVDESLPRPRPPEPAAVVFFDALVAGSPDVDVPWRTNVGGRFEADGWRMLATRGYLRVDLGPGGAPSEGELEVTVTGLDEAALGAALGTDRKVHLINMFSNPLGDHHAEGGGTASDSLWTLRAGTGDDGKPRYGGDLKLLWASRGAKRTGGSDYAERRLHLPTGWNRGPTDRHLLRVRWSRENRRLVVSVGGVVAEFPWTGDGDPLRYVFLGGVPDFNAWPGACFSDLRVRRVGMEAPPREGSLKAGPG
jgi:hypothetical protein